MCGYGDLNKEDKKHTNDIFNKLTKYKNQLNNTHQPLHFQTALDVGAGIGRITYNHLYDICDKIDLLDINNNFLEIAKSNDIKNKINQCFASDIQSFSFTNNYDLIFIQWVLEYLDNKQLIKFIDEACKHLNKNGIMIIKENVNIDDDEYILYEEEGSMIRPYRMFDEIFKFRNKKCEDEENIYGVKVIDEGFIHYKEVEDICELKYWVIEKC